MFASKVVTRKPPLRFGVASIHDLTRPFNYELRIIYGMGINWYKLAIRDNELCYLDIGHSKNSWVWGIDSNFELDLDHSTSLLNDSSLHEQKQYMFKGRVDTKKKIISFTFGVDDRFSDEEFEIAKHLLREKFPGYTIMNF